VTANQNRGSGFAILRFDVPSTPVNYTSMSWNYDYYDDGRLHHDYDSTNNWFDRAYASDHVGRMSEVTTYGGRKG